MDVRKFSIFIVLAGLAVLIYGILGYYNYIYMYQERVATSAQWEIIWAGARKLSKKWIIGGAITTFVGVGLFASSKK